MLNFDDEQTKQNKTTKSKIQTSRCIKQSKQRARRTDTFFLEIAEYLETKAEKNERNTSFGQRLRPSFLFVVACLLMLLMFVVDDCVVNACVCLMYAANQYIYWMGLGAYHAGVQLNDTGL